MILSAMLIALSVTLSLGGPAHAQSSANSVAIALPYEANTLDAHMMINTSAFAVAHHIFDTLVTFNPTGPPLPRLASNYSVSSDGRVWTLKLRPDVKFHDGTPLDSKAVQYNLERIGRPETKSPFRGLLPKFTSIEPTDVLTVRLRTETPFVPLTAVLTHPAFSMQSPTAIERLGASYGTTPVGTGPFKFVQWIRGAEVVVERNPIYWSPRRAERIKFLTIPENTARLAAVRTGAVDVAAEIDPATLAGANEVQVVRQPAFRTIYIGLNATKAPFDNVQVRRAINYAINKDVIVREILRGFGRTSDAPIPPDVFGYRKIMVYEYDPGKAKQLLSQAGLPTGFQTELFCPSSGIVRDSVELCNTIQNQLRQISVNVTIKRLEGAEYFGVLRKTQTESPGAMFLGGSRSITGDADESLTRQFHSSQWPPIGPTPMFYKNGNVDARLDKARQVFDQKERAVLYELAMKTIMDDAPWVFLYDEIQVSAVRKGAHDKGVRPVSCPSCSSPGVASPDCDKCKCDNDSDCKRDCSKCKS